MNSTPPEPDITSVRLTDGFFRVKAIHPKNRAMFVEATMRGEKRCEAYVRGRFAEVWLEDQQITHQPPQQEAE